MLKRKELEATLNIQTRYKYYSSEINNINIQITKIYNKLHYTSSINL